jgi:hypothetical protein
MTDKLRFVLAFYIDLNKVRTIYDGSNQSALIPTTEYCSLHYILSSYDTTWKEVEDYANYKIQKFVVRRTFQTALINVVEWSPLSKTTYPELNLFQHVDGHYFFLDSGTGWLYFRNVPGDWNAWERSRDHKGFMSSKMGGNWDKLGCRAKIGVFTGDTVRFSNVEGNAGQCGFRRVPGSKQSIYCIEDTMIADFASDVLNFTKVSNYTVNRSAFPTGLLTSIYSSNLYPNKLLYYYNLGYLIQVYDVDHSTFLYCTYNLRSRSISMAVWFSPFDFSIWTAVIIVLCLFCLMQVISCRGLHTLRIVYDSLLVIFRILFRQSLSKPKRLSMTLVVFFFTLSLFYENFITSPFIAPPMETPFQNITEAIKAGYIFKDDFESDISNPKGYKRSKNHWLAKLGSDVDPTEPETYIDYTHNRLFPDKKKYIYAFKKVHKSNAIFCLVSDVKHPYKCMQTKEGIGASSYSLLFQGGMKSQLAPVFEWILEASLYRPSEQILNNIREFARRNIQYKLRSYKEEDTLEGNLLTLSNLVPLFIAITFANLFASFLCLIECKGLRWRAVLIEFLKLNRLRLIRVGRLVRSFVSRMIGYADSQWRNLLRYNRDKCNGFQ